MPTCLSCGSPADAGLLLVGVVASRIWLCAAHYAALRAARAGRAA